MTWKIIITDKAKKQLAKLDNHTKSRILNFLYQEDLQKLPKSSGKALVGVFKGLWRYRVGDYRIICQLVEQELTVLTLDIAHRSKVYKTKK